MDIKTRLLIWSPALLGVAFPFLVKLNHALFRAGWETARSAIGVEFVFLLISLLALAAAVFYGFRMAWRGDYSNAIRVAISIAIWFAGFVTGIEAGAALMYAT